MGMRILCYKYYIISFLAYVNRILQVLTNRSTQFRIKSSNSDSKSSQNQSLIIRNINSLGYQEGTETSTDSCVSCFSEGSVTWEHG